MGRERPDDGRNEERDVRVAAFGMVGRKGKEGLLGGAEGFGHQAMAGW